MLLFEAINEFIEIILSFFYSMPFLPSPSFSRPFNNYENNYNDINYSTIIKLIIIPCEKTILINYLLFN